MVVGPLSTLSNWVDEFKRWLPSINVILYHGSKDERQKLRNKHMPLGMADVLASWVLAIFALQAQYFAEVSFGNPSHHSMYL